MEEPEELTFQFLREITDGFSKERIVGEGAFGVVYRGVTKNRDDVAVKTLFNNNVDYKQFRNEFYNLKKLKHQNIVKVFGYCYETKKIPFTRDDGSTGLADEEYRALCFEYLHNGSLKGHLSDEFSGLDWHTRFKIIKGASEGLKYIHELEEPIYHLDLKPDNILLDKDMVPKIADFGLSRIFDKELIRTTKNPYGTREYQPPEYFDRGEISGKFDIFSLGVIMIRIVSGPNGYPKCLEMKSDEFIDEVRRNWTNRLLATYSSDSTLQLYFHQLETCTQIALDCVEKNSHERPNIMEITEKLNEIEAGNELSRKRCRKTVTGITVHNKKMRNASEDISGGRQYINLMTSTKCSKLESVDARETPSDILEELVVGRTEEKVKILASLLEVRSQKQVILPIYGIGGIGKTTFARLIYNDPEFRCYSKVWIHVSQRFDLNKIRESIVSQLSGTENLANEEQMIHCLTKLLSDKKILIVLDDLWEDDQFQLQELKDILHHDKSKLIILVTTRSERVAERIYTNLQPYKILPLTNDMCWYIIKQQSSFESRDDKEQLMGIGWEIAQKCGGVALAARSLGFTLRSMNFDQWMEVKDNDIWNLPISNDVHCPNLLASLKLSYSYMDSCLKLCFAYCAIFPKGHQIVKSDLVYHWISLDFIKPTKILSTVQLCENYIVQLLQLSFFQHSVSPKNVGVSCDDVTVFNMHDLVHDLARSVMVDEVLYGSNKQEGNTSGRRIHFALKEFTQYYCTKIRALCFLESDKTVLPGASSSSADYMSLLVSAKIGLHDESFSFAKYLRILDMSECSIQKLPYCIGKLKELRVLNAPRVQHRVIPDCVTKLSKLIYLSLRGSSWIVALPESIGEMEGLTYLDLAGCSRLKKMPVSFSKLTKLVHLDMSDCSHVTGVSESLESLTNLEYLNLSYCSSVGKLPEHFGSLLELRKLNLSCSSYVEGGGPNLKVLGALTKLECLNLSCSFNFGIISNWTEAFGNLKNLVYLDLTRRVVDHHMIQTLGSFTKLQYLNLSKFILLDTAAPHLIRMTEAMRNLAELRHLNVSNTLSGNEELNTFLLCVSNLPNLEHLDLSHIKKLTRVPDCICSLRKLRTLDILGCPVRSLPATLHEMESLKFLHLNNCFMTLSQWKQPGLNQILIALPHFLVQADYHGSSSNIVLLQDVKATDLAISRLENVMSVEEARSIRLTEKGRLDEMGLMWTKDAQRFVEDMDVLGELIPPRTLQKLHIDGYNSVRLPQWFIGIANYLPSLVRISMSNLSKCNSLPPLGQLPNLEELEFIRINGISKIDWGICGTTRPCFPRLKIFSLHKMERLKVWYTTYSCDGDGAREFMFPILRVLKIHHCPNLRLIPCPHRADERWEIWGRSAGVISSWGKGASSQTSVSSPSSALVTTLHVYNCEVPLQQWRLLHHLPALAKLNICGCNDLRSSQEITQSLSSLRSLTLESRGQPELELPNFLAQLASLKQLVIIGKYEVEAFQNSIGQLTGLRSLSLKYIEGMTALPQWVGDLISLQNMRILSCPNLSDLTERIGGLTSLKRLIISFGYGIRSFFFNEYGIRSLPESIQQLTKLEKLEICFCSKLQRLRRTRRSSLASKKRIILSTVSKTVSTKCTAGCINWEPARC